MKVHHLALAAAVAVVSVAGVAKADAFYASADMAQSTCGADPVVWIDLDRGRYYQLGTAAACQGRQWRFRLREGCSREVSRGQVRADRRRQAVTI